MHMLLCQLLSTHVMLACVDHYAHAPVHLPHSMHAMLACVDHYAHVPVQVPLSHTDVIIWTSQLH